MFRKSTLWVVGALSGVLLVVGVFLPWISVSVRVASLSISGWHLGQDGKACLVMGVVVVLVALVGLTTDERLWAALMIVAAAPASWIGFRYLIGLAGTGSFFGGPLSSAFGGGAGFGVYAEAGAGLLAAFIGVALASGREVAPTSSYPGPPTVSMPEQSPYLPPLPPRPYAPPPPPDWRR